MNDIIKQFENSVLQKQAEIAEKVVEKQYERQPAFWKPFGSEGRRLSVRDAGYHLPFLVEAVTSDDKDVFGEYVAWVKRLFHGLNFPDEVMIVTLECTGEALKEMFDESFHPLFMPFIGEGIQRMHEPLTEIVSFIDTSTEAGKTSRRYTDALLGGDRRTASRIVMEALENKMPVKDIYLEVFQQSQYEVGRLWLNNEISVATEHFCSASTQTIMAQMYPYIFSTNRIGKTLVAACVGGELHELGIRMVTDFFEMGGWDTYYLGANTPAASIIKAIEENEANMVALSAAMPYHRSLLRETIRKIRESATGKNMKIMIGGNAMNSFGDRWSDFDADGYAPNASDAVKEANLLVA
jgi:methanogenic corrinoid protein MtbC1